MSANIHVLPTTTVRLSTIPDPQARRCLALYVGAMHLGMDEAALVELHDRDPELTAPLTRSLQSVGLAIDLIPWTADLSDLWKKLCDVDVGPFNERTHRTANGAPTPRPIS